MMNVGKQDELELSLKFNLGTTPLLSGVIIVDVMFINCYISYIFNRYQELNSQKLNSQNKKRHNARTIIISIPAKR
jgi:hypothetical protein